VDWPFGDLGGFILGTVLLSLLVPIVITLIIVGMIIWAIRRSGGGQDAAERELRTRFARGEIDPAEFRARLESLRRKV
jgi:uncharacterized membrane protein